MSEQKVTVVTVKTSTVAQAVEDIGTYMKGGHPPSITEEPLEEFMKKGRAENCFCDQIACVCKLVEGHKAKCRFRTSVLCPVAIECDHGRDVCPDCDACNCSELP